MLIKERKKERKKKKKNKDSLMSALHGIRLDNTLSISNN